MAWTDLAKPVVPQLGDMAYMNAFKDDINYLHAPNIATYHHPGTGADYTVSGSLGQDVDGTNFSLNLTTYGGVVAACFYGQFKVTSSGNSIRLALVRHETVSYVGRNLFYSYDAEVENTGTEGEHRGFIKHFKDLPAGTHNFRLVWGINPAGTGTLLIGFRPRMTVWEVG